MISTNILTYQDLLAPKEMVDIMYIHPPIHPALVSSFNKAHMWQISPAFLPKDKNCTRLPNQRFKTLLLIMQTCVSSKLCDPQGGQRRSLGSDSSGCNFHTRGPMN